MIMAHDPTRSWPTGKGPDDTSIPGAAWLELLDGQAFPVVGAGVMVRDGNVWTPASSSNPLHVRDSTLVDVLAALTTLAGTVDSGAQKVALTGRNVQPIVRTITSTPLASGQSFTDVTVDLTREPGYGLVGFSVSADTVTTLEVAFSHGSAAGLFFSSDTVKLYVAMFPSASAEAAWFVPPFRPLGGRMRVRVSNPTATNQTYLRVVEYRYPFGEVYPSNLRAVLARGVQIRDTASHTPTTDPQTMFRLTRTALGGGKVPIYVMNTLDQAVNVSVVLTLDGVLAATLGSISVPAASTRVITNSDFAGIDVPSETIRLTLACNVAPTTGEVSAYIDTLVGASA